MLAAPSAQVTELVRYDPAGLLGLLRDALGGSQAGINLGLSGGGYVSSDGRSRLVIARPRRPPFDTGFSHALDARLTSIRAAVERRLAADADPGDEPLPPLAVEFAGGHRIAIETEALIRRESIFNSAGSLAAILPLLFVAYRSLWLVGVGPLPAAMSLLVVLGALGVAGAKLSSAATGAAAMLFGLGIDGVVLLYVAFLLRAANSSDDPAGGLGGPAASMLLGMWTTAATFYGLAFVDFPSLQQLGLLIGHSMLVCGIATLVLVPALLPSRAPSRPVRGLTMPRLAAFAGRRAWPIVVGALAVTALLGAAAFDLKVNPTLERLRSVTGAAQVEARIGPMFGLPTDVYIVLAQGPDLEALLRTNERLADRLAADAPQVPAQLPSRLLPSQHTQGITAQRIAAAGLSPEAVRVSLERAAAVQGFKAGSFDPFLERLPHVLAPEQRASYEGYIAHGLGDLLERFVVRDSRGWTLVSYLMPRDPDVVPALHALIQDVDPSQTLTGLPLVNAELASRFAPEFVKGLAIGSVIVVALIVAAFRSWRLCLYALLPTAIGLVWTAGLLAIARVELDLFAVFAVVTFLGIGVDYGIHLVHRYHEHGDAERATSELAPVILVAGGITLLGYGTLINSSYPPLRSIGLVSAVSVVALAAASVLVLPALLRMGHGR
jgi:predicted RND superfamily exporter protein